MAGVRGVGLGKGCGDVERVGKSCGRGESERNGRIGEWWSKEALSNRVKAIERRETAEEN